MALLMDYTMLFKVLMSAIQGTHACHSSALMHFTFPVRKKWVAECEQ